MIAYNGPTALLITSPVGLDKAIQDIQVQMQAISWLGQRAFGRAFRQEESRIQPGQQTSRRLVYYPEVYQKNSEPLSMMPNDNMAAYSFFYVKDPGKAINYEALQPAIWTYQASVVVWANLKKVDKTKDYRFTELLKLDVLQILRKNTGVEVSQVFESYETVFQNYSITEDYRQYLKPPYSAFRIEFSLSYRDVVAGC